MTEPRTITLEIPVPEPVVLERALWGLVAIALVADVATTQVGLATGLTESNPAARGAIESHGLAGMLGLKAGALAVGVACRLVLERAWRPLVPAGLALPWLAAAAINTYALAEIGVVA